MQPCLKRIPCPVRVQHRHCRQIAVPWFPVHNTVFSIDLLTNLIHPKKINKLGLY